jgi:hypothetical protein
MVLQYNFFFQWKAFQFFNKVPGEFSYFFAWICYTLFLHFSSKRINTKIMLNVKIHLVIGIKLVLNYAQRSQLGVVAAIAFRPPSQLLIIDSNAHCDYVQPQLGCPAGTDVQKYSVRPLALTSTAIMPNCLLAAAFLLSCKIISVYVKP